MIIADSITTTRLVSVPGRVNGGINSINLIGGVIMLYKTDEQFKAKGVEFVPGTAFKILGTSRRGVDVLAQYFSASLVSGYYLTLTPKRASKLVPVS